MKTRVLARPRGRALQREETAVLGVDDLSPLRHDAVAIMASLGCAVLAAHNSLNASEVLQDHPEIRILFTNMRMPGMDGLSVLRPRRVCGPVSRLCAPAATSAERSCWRAWPSFPNPGGWRRHAPASTEPWDAAGLMWIVTHAPRVNTSLNSQANRDRGQSVAVCDPSPSVPGRLSFLRSCAEAGRVRSQAA